MTPEQERAADVLERIAAGAIDTLLVPDEAHTILALLRDHERAVAEAVAKEREALQPWAAFGDRMFDAFWCDGECFDVDAGEAQAHAIELGLLGRTSTHDAGATHADGCEWQPGMADEDCDCFVPLKSAAAIRARATEGRNP